ncbi:nitrite/sulfite reductase [Cupriavidus sp. YR651]|uniref:nitrite/sulfite reductase n=1 Tax=Cupriavidus sp. YR651 TaxID=1855315 RepID=UPI000B87438D|nr:nitrite/sulfite reductase [Cupriavidus sp. YR651]
MYIYEEGDQRLAKERSVQFADQTRRYLSGGISDDEFRSLRLQNGIYIQRHAPMLRVAIPYGMLSSGQLRKLADISRRWDRAYGHFDTRESIQFNWIRLEDAPDVLADLAAVQMYASQGITNGIRHFTLDNFSGIARDEILNPLVWSELIRQWSIRHAEFAQLPRKFRVAVSGATIDRAAVRAHDIGLEAVRSHEGLGFRIWVGGDMGRMPTVGTLIRPFLAWSDLLTYLRATLHVYNVHRCKDSGGTPQLKTLVRDLPPGVFAQQVEEQWQLIRGGVASLNESHVMSAALRFRWPKYADLKDVDLPRPPSPKEIRSYSHWQRSNVHGHLMPGYVAVSLSLRAGDVPAGDITADQMEAVADLADKFGHGQLRISRERNLILTDVRRSDLYDLWRELEIIGLSTPNVGSQVGTDDGFAAGRDFESIPLANAIHERIDTLDYFHDIGEIDLSVASNSDLGVHNHTGHIGVVGFEKAGERWYQVSIGGNQNAGFSKVDPGSDNVGTVAVRTLIGIPLPENQIPAVVERLIKIYLELRDSHAERFVDVVDRVGAERLKRELASIASA